jgi:hypothetical protein
MAIVRTGRVAIGPVERLAAGVGGAMALIHCTAMGFMGWFEPLGLLIDVPALRPLQNAPLGNVFIIVAYALLVVGLRGRAWQVPVIVAGASLWLYLSMYPLYIPWLHNVSLLLWIAIVFAAYWFVRAGSTDAPWATG